MVDGSTSTRWQSAANVDEVEIVIDLEALVEVFSVTATFASLKPRVAVIEKSVDGGETFSAIQYYAQDCSGTFGVAPNGNTFPKCTSSSLFPLTNGDITFDLHDVDQSPEFFVSESDYQLSLATHIRIRLLELPQGSIPTNFDVPFTDSYYSISNIAVMGRVVCNGHSSTVSVQPGQTAQCTNCAHFTQGDNCEECQPLYNDEPFRRGTGFASNACQICDCHSHAESCVQGLNGGICVGCQDNTEGNNCDRCVSGYFRAIGVSIDNEDACQECDCDAAGSTAQVCTRDVFDTSSDTPGTCLCKDNVEGERCDVCKTGFFDLQESDPLGCRECTCNSAGAAPGGSCVGSSACVCKTNVEGTSCDQCKNGFFNLQENDQNGCSACNCNVEGSVGFTCDNSGVCQCAEGYAGDKCDQCAVGFYLSDGSCVSCGCNPSGTDSNTCDETGACSCTGAFTGDKCDMCITGFFLDNQAVCSAPTGDVVVVVDTSANSPVPELTDLAARIINTLQVSATGTHVAVVSYSQDAAEASGFVDSAQAAIAALSELEASSDSTRNTGRAIAFTRNIALAPLRQRDSAPNVVLLLTSGASTDETTSQATLLKTIAEVFVVSSGDEITTEEVNLLASEPSSEHVTGASQPTDLRSLVNVLKLAQSSSLCSVSIGEFVCPSVRLNDVRHRYGLQ